MWVFEDHTAEQEGFTLRVQRNSRVVPFDVTANARGLTGRAGLSLVAETAKVEQHPRMEGRQMLMVLAPK
jgi:hypothetical protein